MKLFFAAIYEAFVYNVQYDLIFRTLYEEGGYIKFGLLFILVPFVMMALFYFVWKYPWSKLWHWFLWLAVISVIVFIASFGVSRIEILASTNLQLNNALGDPSTGYRFYALKLPVLYSLLNTGFSLIMSSLASLIYKSFSVNHGNIPF